MVKEGLGQMDSLMFILLGLGGIYGRMLCTLLSILLSYAPHWFFHVVMFATFRGAGYGLITG